MTLSALCLIALGVALSLGMNHIWQLILLWGARYCCLLPPSGSCFSFFGGLGGCGLGGWSRLGGILGWFWLSCRLDLWRRGRLPRARRVILRTIDPAVVKNLLRFGNLYSAFKTIDRHFVSPFSVRDKPIGFLPSITSGLRAHIELSLTSVRSSFHQNL